MHQPRGLRNSRSQKIHHLLHRIVGYRGCHMAMDVRRKDFDSMIALVERYGGKTQGDNRAADGLRPEGECSIYFFDPDNNRLQITAHASNHQDELLSDEEKWRRIIASRRE